MFKTIGIAFLLNVIVVVGIATMIAVVVSGSILLAPLGRSHLFSSSWTTVGLLLAMHLLHTFLTTPTLVRLITQRGLHGSSAVIVSIGWHYMLAAAFCAIVYLIFRSSAAEMAINSSFASLIVIAPLIGLCIVAFNKPAP